MCSCMCGHAWVHGSYGRQRVTSGALLRNAMYLSQTRPFIGSSLPVRLSWLAAEPQEILLSPPSQCSNYKSIPPHWGIVT